MGSGRGQMERFGEVLGIEFLRMGDSDANQDLNCCSVK